MGFKIKFGKYYRQQLGAAPRQNFSTHQQAYYYGLSRYGSADYDLTIHGQFVGWTVIRA